MTTPPTLRGRRAPGDSSARSKASPLQVPAPFWAREKVPKPALGQTPSGPVSEYDLENFPVTYCQAMRLYSLRSCLVVEGGGRRMSEVTGKGDTRQWV